MGDDSRGLLAFRGQTIRERGEMLNLTDAWKAAGADRSKRPVNWLASKQAKGIIGVLSVVRISDLALFSVEKGGVDAGGATWAHWQLAMAYAQYLSPEFHAWCNETVRDHMTGRRQNVAVDVALLQGPRIGDTPEGRATVMLRVKLVRASLGISTSAVHGFIRRMAEATSPYRVSSVIWPVIERNLDDLAMGRIAMRAPSKILKGKPDNVRQLPMPWARPKT